MIYLLCSPHCICFIPFLQNFEFLLKKNNIPASFVLQYDASTDTGEDLWIVIWNNIPILPKKCIIYNMDPMVPHIEQGIKHSIKHSIKQSPHSTIVALVDYCYGLNRSKLYDITIPYKVLLYGYSPYHQLLKNSIVKDTIKDIDILFYGNISERRVPYIKLLIDFANKNKYRIMVRHYDLFNEIEKIKTIARAKIVISIASTDTKLFHCNDLARSSQVISSGGFIITEYIGDSIVEGKMSKYVPHFDTKEEMLEKVAFYLKHPEEREKLIDIAKVCFPLDFPLEKDLIDMVRAT
jgi:spore maturation protein CgeB